MSALKATPGPWFVHPSGASIRTSARDEIVTYAHIIARIPYRICRGADANLIAAAPTMADYIQRKADEGDAEAARIVEVFHGRG